MESIHIICNSNVNSSSYTEINLLLKQETLMSLLFILLNPTERCLANDYNETIFLFLTCISCSFAIKQICVSRVFFINVNFLNRLTLSIDNTAVRFLIGKEDLNYVVSYSYKRHYFPCE